MSLLEVEQLPGAEGVTIETAVYESVSCMLGVMYKPPEKLKTP